jgi:hypothetical protein
MNSCKGNFLNVFWKKNSQISLLESLVSGNIAVSEKNFYNVSAIILIRQIHCRHGQIRYSESWMPFSKFSLKVRNRLEPSSTQTQSHHFFLIRRKTWSTWEIHSNWMKLSKSLKQYVHLICCLVQYCEIFI